MRAAAPVGGDPCASVSSTPYVGTEEAVGPDAVPLRALRGWARRAFADPLMEYRHAGPGAEQLRSLAEARPRRARGISRRTRRSGSGYVLRVAAMEVPPPRIGRSKPSEKNPLHRAPGRARHSGADSARRDVLADQRGRGDERPLAPTRTPRRGSRPSPPRREGSTVLHVESVAMVRMGIVGEHDRGEDPDEVSDCRARPRWTFQCSRTCLPTAASPWGRSLGVGPGEVQPRLDTLAQGDPVPGALGPDTEPVGLARWRGCGGASADVQRSAAPSVGSAPARCWSRWRTSPSRTSPCTIENRPISTSSAAGGRVHERRGMDPAAQRTGGAPPWFMGPGPSDGRLLGEVSA